jgi:hypothetical protein
MTQNKVLQKYYRRLETEGILKAILAGLAMGILCYFLVTLITWFTPFNGVWLAIGVGVGICLLAIPVSYFILFRPTDRDVAKRLDQLGLEERFLTMVAYQNETGGIYDLQRKDAVAALDKLDVKDIKLSISPVLAIILAVAAALGITMTVLSVKTEGSVGTIINPPIIEGEEKDPGEPFVEEFYCTVTYKVVFYSNATGSYIENVGGYVTGGNTQVVKLGENAQTVTAVADDGFGFAGWTDTLEEETQEASRTDMEIQEDSEYYAIFVLSDNNGGGGDGDPSEGDGDPSDGDGSGEGDGENESNNNGNGNQTGSGSSPNKNNNVIDGDTDYREVLSSYYDQAMQQLADGTLTDEMRAFIEQYYGIII